MPNKMKLDSRIVMLATFVGARLVGRNSLMSKAAEGARDIPAHGKAIVLFDGKSLAS
jgi:hypothetical protein